MLSEAQFRTLKKYLECLGEEQPGVKIDEYTRGLKKGYRVVRALLDNPRESLNHVVENNLDRLVRELRKKHPRKPQEPQIFPLYCESCGRPSDAFLGPDDSCSHEPGCLHIGNDHRHAVWLANSYAAGTLKPPQERPPSCPNSKPEPLDSNSSSSPSPAKSPSSSTD